MCQILNSSITFQKWIAILIVLLLVFSVSLEGLNRYTIRRDELTTLGHIGALENNKDGVPISYTVESLASYSSEHPPIYYIIANIWGRTVDFNYFMLRMLSVWFGIISIAGIYRIGRQIATHDVGIFAMIILGTNVMFFSIVHEMREWSMLLMASVLLWMIYWQLAHKRKPLRVVETIALCSVAAFGLYVNYMIIFVLATLGLYHLVAVPKNKNWWQITLSVLIAGVLFIPWVSVLIKGATIIQGEFITVGNESFMTTIELIPIVSTYWGNGLIALFISSLGLGFVASWMNWKQVRGIIFVFTVMIAGFIIANELFPFIKQIRYLSIGLIPFALTCGLGFALLTRWKITCILPTLLLGIWIISGTQVVETSEFSTYMAKDRVNLYPEYHELIPLLQEHTQKRDLLILAFYEKSVLWKSKQGFGSIHNYYTDPLKLTITNFPQFALWSDQGVTIDSVDYAFGLVPGRDEFWLAYFDTQPMEYISRFQDQVGDSFHVCDSYNYGKRSILLHYVVADNDKICG